jgi:hypothetical protein
MFRPMPFLLLFFAMAMGVNHQQAKNNQAAHHQDDDDRLILPDFANKRGHARIHTTRTYTTSAKYGNAAQVALELRA